MNILLINHYAGSPDHGMEYRAFNFAREWVRNGHRVMIVAAGFSHLRQRNPSFKGILFSEQIAGIDYMWVKTPPYSGNGLPRVLNMLTFLFRLSTTCRRYVDEFKPDAVIAASVYPWDNWVAARYARKHRAFHVYEVRDLWPLSPMELGGLSAWHPFIWSLQRAENYGCRHADMIVSVLPAAGPHLEEHGMTSDRFLYIPNGIVLDDWRTNGVVSQTTLDMIRDFRKKNGFLIGYTGGLALSNAMDVLVDAAADPRLMSEGIGIVCVGDGAEKNRLIKKAKLLNSNCMFLPPVPKNTIPSLLREFDGLYLGWNRSSLYRFGISPNKLFEYMMSGLPIIHAVAAANDPVKESGCGLSISPDNAPELCRAILSLAAMPLKSRLEMGKKGSEYVIGSHDITRLARIFVDEIEKRRSA
ncbi:glycosyltransferase family 4 protein [bacterium]|nr:glycosyltransferase family 4 protein [candidate division CSSED10-310 bacterium]